MDDSERIIAELQQQNQRLQAQLDETTKLLNISLSDSGLVLWQQHIPSGYLSLYNSKYGEICGISEDQQAALYENWKSNLHPEDREIAVKAFEAMINGQSNKYDLEYRMIHKDGSTRWVKDRGSIQEYDENQRPLRVIGTHMDITQSRLDQVRLAQLAHHDTLTGLLNRHAFELQFKEYCQSIREASGTLMFIDLDKFKPINDLYGHTIGDKLLIACAERINKRCPEHGVCGRIGGDEFALLVPFSNTQKLGQLAEQLLASFEQPFNHDKISVAVSLSIGMCSFHRHDEDFQQILHRADQAMYQVKYNGKNNFAQWSPSGE